MVDGCSWGSQKTDWHVKKLIFLEMVKNQIEKKKLKILILTKIVDFGVLYFGFGKSFDFG